MNTNCHDCGVDTKVIREIYMLRGPLWNMITMLDNRIRMLCIGCVEQRIGRKLDVFDFEALTVNTIKFPMSDRMRDRLGDFEERMGEGARRSFAEIQATNRYRLTLRQAQGRNAKV